MSEMVNVPVAPVLEPEAGAFADATANPPYRFELARLKATRPSGGR